MGEIIKRKIRIWNRIAFLNNYDCDHLVLVEMKCSRGCFASDVKASTRDFNWKYWARFRDCNWMFKLLKTARFPAEATGILKLLRLSMNYLLLCHQQTMIPWTVDLFNQPLIQIRRLQPYKLKYLPAAEIISISFLASCYNVVIFRFNWRWNLNLFVYIGKSETRNRLWRLNHRCTSRAHTMPLES